MSSSSSFSVICIERIHFHRTTASKRHMYMQMCVQCSLFVCFDTFRHSILNKGEKNAARVYVSLSTFEVGMAVCCALIFYHVRNSENERGGAWGANNAREMKLKLFECGKNAIHFRGISRFPLERYTQSQHWTYFFDFHSSSHTLRTAVANWNFLFPVKRFRF